MRKNLILAASCLFLAGSLLTGCSKDDTTPPVITINGNSSVESILNQAYTDAGATASDDEDGTLTVTTSGTVNKDLAGSYVITYTATDKAGNQGSATRTVRVYNQAEVFAGTYNVVDSFPGTSLAPYPYTQTIRVDSVTNLKLKFNKFADYANNTNIIANANSSVTSFDIPFQTAANIGTGTGCNVADHTFQSTANSFSRISSTTFRFTYVDAIINGGTCNASTTVNSYWVKQ